VIGATLGPYHLLAELGAGGMGQVWRAEVSRRDFGLETGAVVALKIVHPHLLETPGCFRRFLREAEVGAAIRHETVVRTFGADAIRERGADVHYLVMEYVDSWGELCASKEVASAWADRLIVLTQHALHADHHVHFHGTSACLSALYRAERRAEVLELLEGQKFWPYRRWAVKALAAMGMPSEAILHAESCPDGWSYDLAEVCEEILLGCGRVEEAYTRYAVSANCRETYVGTFKAIVAKYRGKSAGEILADLVRPGEEGKWFAAAKDAGLYEQALDLASRSPCDPRTLTRAARDFAEKQPAFAVGAGLLALHWLVHGHGYEITAADVHAAYASTMAAAERAGNVAETRQRVRDLVGGGGGLARESLHRELGP